MPLPGNCSYCERLTAALVKVADGQMACDICLADILAERAHEAEQLEARLKVLAKR